VRELYRRVLSEKDRTNLISNICLSLKACRPEVQENMLRLFYKVDEDYGNRIAAGLGYKETSSFL
jgi:catalase